MTEKMTKSVAKVRTTASAAIRDAALKASGPGELLDGLFDAGFVAANSALPKGWKVLGRRKYCSGVVRSLLASDFLTRAAEPLRRRFAQGKRVAAVADALLEEDVFVFFGDAGCRTKLSAQFLNARVPDAPVALPSCLLPPHCFALGCSPYASCMPDRFLRQIFCP